VHIADGQFENGLMAGQRRRGRQLAALAVTGFLVEAHGVFRKAPAQRGR
jgi:hypothetical protein